MAKLRELFINPVSRPMPTPARVRRLLTAAFRTPTRPSTQARPRVLGPIEHLEDRCTPAIIVVTSLADNTTVDGLVTLREAIRAANTDTSVDGSAAGNGADVIQFAPALYAAGDVTITLSLLGDANELAPVQGFEGQTQLVERMRGPSALAINSTITIEGPTGDSGVTLAGGGVTSNLRAFYIDPAGDLTLRNLTVRDFRHKGGDGGDGRGGGGGGAGLGGSVFVDRGAFTADRVTFAANTAQGGVGGFGGFNAGPGGSGGGLNGGFSAPPASSGRFGGGGGGGGSSSLLRGVWDLDSASPAFVCDPAVEPGGRFRLVPCPG